ncbi:diguanylate cyclase (GGDEF)-like protein [Desulfitispora alkaliphila]|uniref:response regulator n=1 Tax=Desulfitispora alkaliphila TaxID=622674 RepID=UPI003D24C977
MKQTVTRTLTKIDDSGVYQLGFREKDFSVISSAYIIIDQYLDDSEGTYKKEVVIIDPGSVINVSELKDILTKIIEPGELKYVILQHQDPDLCAVIPFLEHLYGLYQYVAHWRGAVLIKHYGIKNPFYFIDQRNFKLQLKSGRELLFFHTPYAHSPAAIMTYDTRSKILFSGDLFGAFSTDEYKELDESYLKAMGLFHENYIPSQEIMKLMLARVEKIKNQLGINLIAPQHGLIIDKSNTEKVIAKLGQINCGKYLIDLEEELLPKVEDMGEIDSEITPYINLIDYMSQEMEGLYNQNRMLNQKMEEIGDSINKDPLTGLYRKQYFVDFLNKLLEEIQLSDLNKACLAAFSIDNIANINQRHGEKYGDRIITKVAETVKNNLPANYMVFKYLGPTFFIIFPEVELEQCRAEMEAVKNKILQASLEWEQVNISGGITPINKREIAQDGSTLIEHTLQKIKVGQKQGGNRVILNLDKLQLKVTKKVLIADPNEVSRRIIANIVQGLGFDSVVAADGVIAQDIIKKEEVDMVICEALLTKRDGYSLLSFIKTDSYYTNIPVVFVSSVDYPEKVTKALKMGAADYLVKPFSTEIMRTKIKLLLSKS